MIYNYKEIVSLEENVNMYQKATSIRTEGFNSLVKDLPCDHLPSPRWSELGAPPEKSQNRGVCTVRTGTSWLSDRHGAP